LVRFARYAKILLTSGLSFLEVFTLLKNVIDVPLFTTMFDTIIDGLNRGQNITDGMRDTDLIMPSSVVALIKVGEKTASMAGSFDTIISIYSEELEHRIGTLSKIIEPIMLVFV
jgi:type II secretory pathway component PulF